MISRLPVPSQTAFRGTQPEVALFQVSSFGQTAFRACKYRLGHAEKLHCQLHDLPGNRGYLRVFRPFLRPLENSRQVKKKPRKYLFFNNLQGLNHQPIVGFEPTTYALRTDMTFNVINEL